jgi:hypothetical protein
MHRTQIKKKKNRIKDFPVSFFFLFPRLSQFGVWEDTWVQSELCQIIQ